MGGGGLCFVAVREAEGLSITCTLPSMDPQQGGILVLLTRLPHGDSPALGDCSEENHVLG